MAEGSSVPLLRSGFPVSLQACHSEAACPELVEAKIPLLCAGLQGEFICREATCHSGQRAGIQKITLLKLLDAPGLVIAGAGLSSPA